MYYMDRIGKSAMKVKEKRLVEGAIALPTFIKTPDGLTPPGLSIYFTNPRGVHLKKGFKPSSPGHS